MEENLIFHTVGTSSRGEQAAPAMSLGRPYLDLEEEVLHPRYDQGWQEPGAEVAQGSEKMCVVQVQYC